MMSQSIRNSHSNSHSSKRVYSVVALVVLLAACDRGMPITGDNAAPPVAPSAPGAPVVAGVVEGSVDGAGNITLTPVSNNGTSFAPGISPAIYGSQDVNVHVYAKAATVTTAGGTKTWTMNFGVRNYLPYPIGSNQASLTPADTLGVYLGIISGPTPYAFSGTCSNPCTMSITKYDGKASFTAPGQPYVYWPRQLAAKQAVAGADTTVVVGSSSGRRTFQFTSKTQVTNFRFYLLVAAAWPPPHETNWSVFYNAPTDSAPDVAAKPRWRSFTEFGTLVGSLGTETWHSGDSLTLSNNRNQDYYLYRADSMGTATPAYFESALRMTSPSTSQPQTVIGLSDGTHMAALGMTTAKVGLVEYTYTTFFSLKFPTGWQFIGNTVNVNTTKPHVYRLRKFGSDSVTVEIDGVKQATLSTTYNQLPGSANEPGFASTPSQFFSSSGIQSNSGTTTARIAYATYGIGSSQP